MKRYFKLLLLFLVSLALHLGSTHAYSGFLITLKTDRTLYVENFKMEGDQLVLYLRSGVVKISKDEVQSILEEKGRSVTEEKEEKEEKGEKEEVGEVKKDVPKKESSKKIEEKKPVEDPGIKKEEIENYKKRKTELSQKLEEAKTVYFNVTDKLEKKRARKTMAPISKELFTLQEEVKKRNKGVLPEWWEEN